MKRLIIAYTEEEKQNILNEYKEKFNFNKHELKEIYNGLNNLPKDLVDLYANKKYNYKQMNSIRSCLYLCGKEKTQIILNPSFNENQMNIIIRGYLDNLNEEEINLFANPLYDWGKMLIMESSLSDGHTIEEVSLMKDVDEYECLGIRMDLDNGLSIEEIRNNEGSNKIKRLIKI